MNKKTKPGVMVYFDMLPVIAQLSNADKGKLFQAILEYAQLGVVPELPAKLRPLWPMITSRMDHDDIRYQRTVAKRKYAAYARWEREDSRIPLPFVSWMQERNLTHLLQDEDFHASA